MQLLFDVFPVFAFVGVYLLSHDIYLATATLMAGMVILVAYHWLRYRKVSGILLGSTVLALVLGGITIALHNPEFIKWKVTVVYWMLAAAFLGSQIFGAKTLIERMMGEAVELAPRHWRYLNSIWAVMFALIGAVNLFVMYHYDETTWVYFKLWGQIAMYVILAIATFIVLWLCLPQSEADKTG